MAEMLIKFEEAWRRSLSGHYSRENDELIRNLAIQISSTYIPKFLKCQHISTINHANRMALYAKSL